MCGIFGIISNTRINDNHLKILSQHARQRGRDSSGIIFNNGGNYTVGRSPQDVQQLMRKFDFSKSTAVMGHSRLVTNGLNDNQPIVRDNVLVLHNGIIVNETDAWSNVSIERQLTVDSEVIAALALEHVASNGLISELPTKILSVCKGVIACAIAFPELGKLLLFSNNGSLYVGWTSEALNFSSERYPLSLLNCTKIKQITNKGLVVDIPKAACVDIKDHESRTENLIPNLVYDAVKEKLLEYRRPIMRRCTRCILPETMPFISFDASGVCNYCLNYKTRNSPKPKEELFKLVEPFRRTGQNDCIVPFSGGRDSCYGLHLIIKELGMNPIAYTYDWGMVTDLGRRNISRMCAELGVENITVAADITKKRRNIATNLKAWLKAPHLGMVSILTAGDKHFFRHVETVKRQTGITLNLWGVNPLEVTHFKAGFLGVKPDFEEKRVYMNGAMKQLDYQSRRFAAMLKSPGYFNSSLWDTLSGEYYRSFTEKSDYFHIFDYWKWDEDTIDRTLKTYDWELAPDTKTTWRIGDGTAAFYNYIYYTVAGFTEHDTFRSNQIREGQMTRERALELVQDENQPRYQNIKWYLDALSMDFDEVIKAVNRIPKLYNTTDESFVWVPNSALT